MKWIALKLIEAYRFLISPLLGNHCRFVPTCSEYAHEAYEKKGFLQGSLKTLFRILRCQPFCKGGYDPIITDVKSTKDLV